MYSRSYGTLLLVVPIGGIGTYVTVPRRALCNRYYSQTTNLTGTQQHPRLPKRVFRKNIIYLELYCINIAVGDVKARPRTTSAGRLGEAKADNLRILCTPGSVVKSRYTSFAR